MAENPPESEGHRARALWARETSAFIRFSKGLDSSEVEDALLRRQHVEHMALEPGVQSAPTRAALTSPDLCSLAFGARLVVVVRSGAEDQNRGVPRCANGWLSVSRLAGEQGGNALGGGGPLSLRTF